MHINNIHEQKPFITADGSAIRSILDSSNAPVTKQSLAEARLPADSATERHFHKISEEFYYMVEGQATMEIDGHSEKISAGDATLIPTGSWHQITASEGQDICFLCCCSPPYSHEDTYFK